MTDSNDANATNATPPLTPLTPMQPVTPEPGPAPGASTPPEGAAFHERVASANARSTATRVGVITGSALLVLVGVAAAMGASPSPATNGTSGVGADPSASAVAPAAPGASAAPDTTKPNGPRPDRGGFGFRGGIGIGLHDITITAIDGSSVSVATEDGWTRTIEVTDTTTITKGGTTISVGDLAVGDEIRFRQQRADDGTYTVTAIVVVLPHVIGEITAIDGNTITVTQPGGTRATIHVDSDTTYRVNGATGSASDLKVGAVIAAEGTQRSDGSLDAATIHSGLKDGRGHHGFPDGLGPDKVPAASPAPSSGAS
ncbi:MAG TPA: DUF5666 domain-containing protein [Candidatus Limnocylindrales bacterium]